MASEIQKVHNRVIQEERELSDKIKKLETFTGTQIWLNLSQGERDRLMKQLGHMINYLDVLRERIEANFMVWTEEN